MRHAKVYMQGIYAGMLTEERRDTYIFAYTPDYDGLPISLTMPVQPTPYWFDTFPAFFDGLLPEGAMLEGLLRQRKIDRRDYFSQLVSVGGDLVGAVTVEEAA